MFQFLRSIGRRPSTIGEQGRPADVAMSPLLAGYIDALTTPADTDEAVRAAAESMRADEQSVVAEISGLLGQGDEGPLRQLLALALGELNHPSAVVALRAVASRSIEPSDGESSRSSVRATAVQMTAVEGLEKLARAGNVDAVDALVAIARGNISLAATATSLTALRGLDGNTERFEEALAGVPGEHRYLGALKRIDVREATQIGDPARHLTGRAASAQRPPTSITSDRDSEAPAPGAPRLR